MTTGLGRTHVVECLFLANAVKAPLTYVAVFFILQWLWDFIIIGKLHGYIQHLFELTGEGIGCSSSIIAFIIDP